MNLKEKISASELSYDFEQNGKEKTRIDKKVLVVYISFEAFRKLSESRFYEGKDYNLRIAVK